MSRTILVAGGAGSIGRHFCGYAAEKGYTPITIDHVTHSSTTQRDPLDVADIGNEEQVLALIAKYNPVAAICFTSMTPNPDMDWEHHFHKVMRFFNALEHGGLRHVVFSSPAAVYGNPVESRPLGEDDALAPVTPYGMAHLACEIALQGLSNRTQASDAFIDEFSKHALALKATYPEFRASFFPCLNSVIFRIFRVADEDVATAYILGLEYLLAGGKNDVFNLGTGKDAADANKAEKMLGWKATHPIATGVSQSDIFP